MEYRIDKKTNKIYTAETYWDAWAQSMPDRAIVQHSFEQLEKVELVYDSRIDTMLHIKRVAQLLSGAAGELLKRAGCHDDSKLTSPEKELFDVWTPKLAGATYGSEEYLGFLKELKVALDHHYANNSHHPEHYKNGVNGFDLFDLIEMFFDWKAASERHDNGDIYLSIIKNQVRFNLSDQVVDIFNNTAKKLGWEK